ncbi:MAG: hypothetical protein NTW86_21790 [Candidatus Sumerlaeota bacterium]|nr:hypothetical protein [Candidatus Sumerlaeota bacterium]
MSIPPFGSFGAPALLRWALIIGFALEAVLLVVAARKPLWNNDFITLSTIALPWKEVSIERMQHNHMPAYFLALKAWTEAFGMSELSLRAISALSAAGSIALAWGIAAWAWGAGAGVAAAWLAGWNEGLLDGASQARMYAMVQCLTLLSMFLYLRILRGARKRVWAAHLAVSVAGLSTHLLFGAALAVQAVHAAMVRRRIAPKAWRVWALLAAPWALIAPLFLFWVKSQHYVGQDAWRWPSVGSWLRQVYCCLWGDYETDPFPQKFSRVLGWPLMLGALGLLVVGARRAGRRLDSDSPAPAESLALTLLPWWFVLPAVGVFLTAMRAEEALGSVRYYAPTMAAAPLAIVAAWREIRRPVWRRAFLAAALALCAWYAMGFIFGEGSGLRWAVSTIAGLADSKTAVVVCDRGAAAEAFAYYGHPEVAPGEISRREGSSEALLKQVGRACAGRERLAVLLFHEGHTPLVRVLEKSGLYVSQGAPMAVGESRILLYRVLPARPEPAASQMAE